MQQSYPCPQILDHALSQKDNKTKFKLIFANVEERDILLREEFEVMKKKYPQTFDVVFTLDKPGKNWTGTLSLQIIMKSMKRFISGERGYVDKKLLEKHLAPASLGERVKVFVCGLLM